MYLYQYGIVLRVLPWESLIPFVSMESGFPDGFSRVFVRLMEVYNERPGRLVTPPDMRVNTRPLPEGAVGWCACNFCYNPVYPDDDD